MPRNGAGVFSKLYASFVAGTTAESAKVNGLFDDLVTDANTARPIVAGGTGGVSVITGWDGLAAKGTDIVSASSINLTTATGPSLTITGTTAITGVTLAEGSIRVVRAAAALPITASASLLVNGSASASITCTAEDILIFRGGAGGVVTVTKLGGGASLASPAFTGVPTAPTAAVGTNTTQLATTAFVAAGYRAKGSGRMLAALGPTDQEFFGSLAAPIDVRNNHPIAVFPDAVVNLFIGTVWLDLDYAGGGITVDIDWMCSTTSTLKACFGVYVERVDVGTTDMDADSFGAETIDTTGVAANATSGIASRTTIVVTSGNMDSAVAGDKIRLKIARETGQANDTNAGDIQVMGIRVKET